jgi:hypothetical protein
MRRVTVMKTKLRQCRPWPGSSPCCLAADAASPVQLGKKARMLNRPAQERKKSQQEWNRSVDDFLRREGLIAR